jgi:hypothetical protein
MTEKSDTLSRNDKEQQSEERNVRREEALSALRRLREIGEKLPVIDAATVIRENRNLMEQNSRS